MREARLARTKVGPTADDRSRRSAVMRRTEGRSRDEWMLAVDEPGHGMNARDLEGSLGVEQRQDPGKPACQHRLPRPGRAAEEQVVLTRRRELESPPRAFLPADVG